MTEKDMLSVATHYFELGKFQEAYDKLTAMVLKIDRMDQIEHHVLLSDILEGLQKHEEAQELSDTLLSKFPDDDQCISHWIRQASDDFDRVEKAYDMAKGMQKTDPHYYWYPMMMAYMAFDYRLQPKSVIIQLVEQTIDITRNEQTLLLACKIFSVFHKSDEVKPYLDELVELAPDAESTYLILLEFLAKNKRYTELGQVSYEAIRKYPTNQELVEFLEMATDHLYGGYFGRVSNLCIGIGKKIIIPRSSSKAWYRVLQQVSSYFGMVMGGLILMFGIMIGLLGALFFFHYFLYTDDERNIKKQRKRRSQKHEFEYDDQTIQMNGVASALVSSTHLKYRFISLNAEAIVLAKDVWCPVENLHFDFDTEHLPGHKVIAHDQIKQVEASSKYLTIKTVNNKHHVMYFEKLETFDFIIGQLRNFNYHFIKTKRSSRILLSIFCFFGTKSCLALAVLLSFESWKIGLFLIVVVLTNFLSLFIYRFVRPLKTDIYLSM